MFVCLFFMSDNNECLFCTNETVLVCRVQLEGSCKNKTRTFVDNRALCRLRQKHCIHSLEYENMSF